jgi:hypothetical protein
MKLYISGRISGLPLQYAQDRFNFGIKDAIIDTKATKEQCVNPFNIKPFLGVKKWLFYMIADLYQLRKCDAIYMLNNWKDSRGAKIELVFAILCNKEIYFQEKKR